MINSYFLAENEDDHVESTANGSQAGQDQINHVMSEEMSSDDELEAANEVGMSLEEFIEHVRVKGRLLLLLVTFLHSFFKYHLWVLLFANFIFIFDRLLNLVVIIVLHLSSCQIFSLKLS